MDIKFDPTMVRVWLDVLHDGAPGLIHICATEQWAGQAFTDRDAAVAYAAQLEADGREGIYLRTTTLRGPLAPGQRGGEADSLAFPGLACDIDIAGPGHKTAQALPPDEDAARAIVKESGLPEPTLWVHSGGGMYPWWLLTAPHTIDSPDDLTDLQRLSQQWEAVIAAAAARLGWHFGVGVRDLARVLRIPGTINRKAGLARPCTVASIADPPRRYTLAELRDALADATAALPEPEQAPAPRHLTPVPAGDGAISPGDDYENRVDWADILTPHGWRYVRSRGAERHWQRPGKTGPEISATTGREADRDRLFVFTTSTEFEAWKSYTKLGAYAILEHGGDHKAAAQALKAEGYGRSTPLSGSVEQSRAIAELVPPSQAPAPGRPTLTVVDGNTARVVTEPAPAADRFGPTEDGLARALVAHHGTELRFCPQRGRWLHWNGHQWAWDDAEHHREHVRALARQLPDGEGWTTFKKRALSAAGVTGIARLAQSDRAFVVHLDQLDADPWALNTPAGIVDLRTGQIRPSDPAALCTRSTDCAPDTETDGGRWSQFLADTFGQDEGLISYLQRLVGYSAVGLVGPHVLPFAFGSGGNGKGVFLEALAGVLGDYATTAPVGFLMSQMHAKHETEIARLAGARMVVCSEVNEDDRFDEAKVKQLTGGDTLTARFMNKDHFSFRPTHQLWLMGNSQPAVRSGGRSFWRRLRLIPFEHEVPEEKVQDDLQGLLIRDHGPAMMAWIVAGAVAYHQAGLQEPDSVKAATAEYAHDQNTVARFVEDSCHLGGGEHVRLKVSKVREAYEAWCFANGEKPVSAKSLTTNLKKLGVDEGRTNKARLYVGIALLADDEDGEKLSPELSPELSPPQGGW